MKAISGDCLAKYAIRLCFVNTSSEFRCIRRVSQIRFHDSTSRFPPLAPTGRSSPASSVLSKRYDFLMPISPHFVSFAWRYLGCTRYVRSLVDECATKAWSCSSGISCRMLPRKQQDLPSSWGTSVVRLPCSNPTPAGLLVSDPYDKATWPLVCKKQRLPRQAFRSSIAWLSDSLSTLRSADYSNPTQDSLPVAGQALLDGIHTRKVPMKGFKVVKLHLILLSQACLAQSHHLRSLAWRRN